MTETGSGELRKRPSGRRVGDSGTRDAIFEAARDLFAEHGFDGASMRAIAARAGVDPGLIRHFFTDKETLFAATMADRGIVPQRVSEALAGDPARLGERVTETYLGLWEDDETRPILLALVRSAVTSERSAALLRDLLAGRLEEADADGILGGSPQAMAGLAASLLFGVAMARHIVKVPAVAAIDHDALVSLLAPTVQAFLTAGTSSAR